MHFLGGERQRRSESTTLSLWTSKVFSDVVQFPKRIQQSTFLSKGESRPFSPRLIAQGSVIAPSFAAHGLGDQNPSRAVSA